MSGDHDAEPVFVRSAWGTNRYVYNPNDPVGRALIVGSVLFAIGGIYSLYASTAWSEGELWDAVHGATRALEAEPQRVSSYAGGYEALIREAVGVIEDELVVRVGPDSTEAALARPGVRVFDFTGRPMRGWVVVAASVLAEDTELDAWIDEGHTFAGGLPPK